MYLVPPMDDVPPDDFVRFVAVHLADLQREASRLTGGHADEIYPDVLADLAGHWRRLRLRRRLSGHDASADYLARRVVTRAKQWRDDQIYQVEVHPLRSRVPAVARSSIALRKASLLPGTVRLQQRPVAEAAIAWEHAWRRARWHRLTRTGIVILLALVVLMQAVPPLPT